MGATGWMYITPWRGDIAATFEALQQEVFAAGDYYPAREHPDWRATTLQDLYQDEELAESGTHSILDIRQVLDPDEHPGWPVKGPAFPERVHYFGTLRPLPTPVIWELFGTDEPTRADFERVDRDEDLTSRFHVRHTGVGLVLYADGRPSEVVFWGSSGT